jgi:uncharacterized membrane protein
VALAADEPTRTKRKESRVFAALTVFGIVAVMAVLPGRYRVLPPVYDVVLGVVLATLILLAGFMPATSTWSRVERYTIGAIVFFLTILEIIILALLLRDMASHGQTMSGTTLLSTAVGLWLANVVIFALLYSELDRGGPVGRSLDWEGRVDFTFPRGAPEDALPADWQPHFADYLFLAFTASTAFSPTDTLPLTVRAKMLMMAQSLISLVTVVAVAARAINILGT